MPRVTEQSPQLYQTLYPDSSDSSVQSITASVKETSPINANLHSSTLPCWVSSLSLYPGFFSSKICPCRLLGIHILPSIILLPTANAIRALLWLTTLALEPPETHGIMRIHSNLLSVLFGSTILPNLVSASGFDCGHINAEGFKYDLSPLGGAHSIYHVEELDQYVVNTTYVLNICNILKGAANRGSLKCGTSKNSMCPTCHPRVSVNRLPGC